MPYDDLAQAQRAEILYLLGGVDTNVKSLLAAREQQEQRLDALESWKTKVTVFHGIAFAVLPILGALIPSFLKDFLKAL